MKASTTLHAIIIVFAFASCKKGTNIPDPATLSKVKTYTEDVTSASAHTVATFNLAYDANNRPISITSAASQGDRFEYQYSTGSFTMDLYNSNLLSVHEVFYLNSNQFIDSTFQYNDTHDTTTEKYIYNINKQLITLKSYDYLKSTGSVLSNIENHEYDSNGNLVKVTDDNSVTTYDYYPDLVNNLVFGTPYSMYSKNLVKTTTSDATGVSVTFNHVYTFDSNKRIITEKITADNGENVIKSYTYY